GEVHVGADLKGNRQRVVAVVGGLRRHVQRALDAVDLLLDRGRHGVGHHLRVGARVARRHLHRGGRDVGVQLGGEKEVGHPAAQENDEGHHPGEDRPVDEEPCEHARHLYFLGGGAGASFSTGGGVGGGEPCAGIG